MTYHGQVAGIQVEDSELELIMQDHLRGDIVSKFREIGFCHIAVHLGDYVSGVVNSIPEVIATSEDMVLKSGKSLS